MQSHETDEQTYETPEIVDHGTLLDLTLGGSHANSDAPFGANDTAYAPGQPS